MSLSDRVTTGNYGKRSPNKRTLFYTDVFCPNCGQTGQLKQQRTNSGSAGYWYWYVHHYKLHRRIGGYHGKYSSSCFLGKHILLVGKSTIYVIDHDTIVPPFYVNRYLYPNGELKQ